MRRIIKSLVLQMIWLFFSSWETRQIKFSHWIDLNIFKLYRYHIRFCLQLNGIDIINEKKKCLMEIVIIYFKKIICILEFIIYFKCIESNIKFNKNNKNCLLLKNVWEYFIMAVNGNFGRVWNRRLRRT